MAAKDQWKKSSVTGAAGVHVYFQILFLKSVTRLRANRPIDVLKFSLKQTSEQGSGK